MTAAPRIIKFREYRNPAGTMLGFVDIELGSGLVLHSCKLMVGPRGKRFISPPSEKRRDRDDRPVLDAAGKPTYDAIVDFRDKATRDRFNDIVLEVLRRSRPELFTGEPQV